MKVYIKAAGNISPQDTLGDIPFLSGTTIYTGNRLSCIEPDYRSFIEAKLIRRMSRIIKMGVAAAKECLRKADVAVPDAIVTGTAYGCLEDTGIFLSRMVEQQEELLAPTAFIQSTHNTVGAQIALGLQCNGYNNVFVHRGFSFENALLDAMLLIRENEAGNVLVGGMDEITDQSHTILSRMGLYKRTPVQNTDLYKAGTRGTIAGEGAAFFLLTNQASPGDLATLNAVTTFYKPKDIKETTDRIEAFLFANAVVACDIDLVILGRNGDSRNDHVYGQLTSTVFSNLDTVNYKHLCGDYPTSTAFALWLGISILYNGIIPAALNSQGSGKKPNRILIYTQSQNIHHSLLLISAC